MAIDEATREHFGNRGRNGADLQSEGNIVRRDKKPSVEDLETKILVELALELGRMFPGHSVAPLFPLRDKHDGLVDKYGLSSAQEALRLYMAVKAHRYLFCCRTSRWVVPEPLYGLCKGDWGVRAEELLSTGPFHIGIAWVEGYGRSAFEPQLRRFLSGRGCAPCKR